MQDSISSDERTDREGNGQQNSDQPSTSIVTQDHSIADSSTLPDTTQSDPTQGNLTELCVRMS